MNDRPKIAVVGAGLMGCGIAQVFAVAGHQVRLTDSVAGARDAAKGRIAAGLLALGQDKAALGNVSVHERLADTLADADLVIEAALENLPLKQTLFAEMEGFAKPDAILASSTSVISITQIMARLKRKQRALGTHWWNPPTLVPLVEVIRTVDTDDHVVAATMCILRQVGKTPVEVKKDVVGFVGNRMQHALWREAIAIVADGICDAQTVDIVVKASFGRRLSVLGPLENADLVGTDLTLAIHQYVLGHINAAPEPSQLLQQLVHEGKLGMKSGEGFRHWTAQEADALRGEVVEHLKYLASRDASPRLAT